MVHVVIRFGRRRRAVKLPQAEADYDMDHDRWYSSLDKLYEYAGLQEVPLTYEEKLDVLWTAHPELH